MPCWFDSLFIFEYIVLAGVNKNRAILNFWMTLIVVALNIFCLELKEEWPEGC